jgi:hypothetical protein
LYLDLLLEKAEVYKGIGWLKKERIPPESQETPKYLNLQR